MSCVDGGPSSGTLRNVVLEWQDIEPDHAEVLRYLGYPAGAGPEERIGERMAPAERLARQRCRPRAVCSIYPVVEAAPRSLTFDGGAVLTGPVGEFLHGAQRAAVFVATAGVEVVCLSEEAFAARDTLGGLLYSAIGSHLADAALGRLVVALGDTLGPDEALTLPFSPGYCGISLSQQQTIFQLVDARLAGVELLPALVMKPVKSISGVIGMGPRSAVSACSNPCERCPRLDCSMRR